MSIQVNFNADIVRYININIPYSSNGIYARYINYPVYELNYSDASIELAAGTVYPVKFPASNEIWFRFSCASNTHGLPLVFVGDRNNATGVGAREDMLDDRPEYFAIILNGVAEDVQYEFPTGWEDTGGWEFVLHFKSGTNDGLFEITCRDSAYAEQFDGWDPEEIFEWLGTRDGLQTWQRTGNVNNGAPISSVSFLLIAPSWTEDWTDGPTARFGNIVVSDKPIDINGELHFDKFNFDVQRDIVRRVNIRADVQLDIIRPVNENFDVLRQLPYRFSTMAVSEVEIEIATQQVTDRLSFTTVNDVEIMRAVKGSYLDYDFDMRIESIQRRGIVSKCQCCSDIDELLYKQFAYSLPQVALSKQRWHSTSSGSAGGNGDSGKPDWYPKHIWHPTTWGVEMIPYIETNVSYPDTPAVEEADLQPKAAASSHAAAIAHALGKKLVVNINDFVSTVSTEHEGGSTYADLISNIFGWTARIPTLMINCFIRDDTLFITQRGYEPNTVDITYSKHSLPTVKQELIKTFWHGNTWTRTETRTVTEWEFKMTATNYFDDFNNPTVTTNHQFEADGLVSKTTREETKSDGTELEVETDYEYLTLYNGRKFLNRETTRTYEDGKLVDTQIIEHQPLGQGQSYAYASDEDGEYLGSNVGRGRDDDRYNRGKRTELPFMTFEWIQTKNDPESRTIPGITNFDTSFPVYGEEPLIAITRAIKDLNRRTQETVTVDVYDLPHVIDFNDRIVFHGKIYFLEHNYAVKTTRIVNKQTVTMVRWF